MAVEGPWETRPWAQAGHEPLDVGDAGRAPTANILSIYEPEKHAFKPV